MIGHATIYFVHQGELVTCYCKIIVKITFTTVLTEPTQKLAPLETGDNSEGG